MNAIKRARQQADSILSRHEISFCVLVLNDALECDLERQYGYGLVDMFTSVAWWERIRFRRKLKALYQDAQVRAYIKARVTGQGVAIIEEYKAREWPEYLDHI